MRWASLVVPLALAGCRSAEPDGSTAALDAGADAATEAGTGEPFPTQPYPAGPYGTGVGDVFPDFTVVGYRMSRAHRDSTKLAFENLRLAEIRSDPSCTCLVVIFNAAGTACGPCVQEDATFSKALLEDAGMCALELIDFNFDTFDSKSVDNNQPPTRADLDTFTQAGREPFPVGLMTGATRKALATQSIPVIPDAFVMRPADMRVVGFLGGTGGRLGETARYLCSHPTPTPQVVAADVDAEKILLDESDLFFTDTKGAVMRVPASGGTPALVAATAGTPRALALDATHVYWATASEIGRASRAGGGTTTLAPGASSIALDASNVYFTRTDGVIGAVPIGGGPPKALRAGELEPGAIVADATRVYFVASPAQVVSMGKDGSDRTTILAASDLPQPAVFTDLRLHGDSIYVLARDPSARFFGSAVVRVSLAQSIATTVITVSPSPAFAFDTKNRIVIASQDPASDVCLVGRVGSDVEFQPTNLSPFNVLFAGIPGITSLAADDAWVYFASRGSIRRASAP